MRKILLVLENGENRRNIEGNVKDKHMTKKSGNEQQRAMEHGRKTERDDDQHQIVRIVRETGR